MKKFLIVCVLLFIAGVGCKKLDIDGGGGLCACSPISGPAFHLVIKNTAGEDLLNENTTGAYSKGKIEFFRKDEAGKVIPLGFSIRPPFTYGEHKVDFNVFYASDLNFLQAVPSPALYLKLGEKLYELNLQLKIGEEKLLIDKKEAEKDAFPNYLPIFYLVE